MTEADNTIDRRIDHAIMRAIEESQFKRLTVLQISREIQFTRGITTHLQEMKGRGLIAFIGEGEINMDTEVSVACG